MKKIFRIVYLVLFFSVFNFHYAYAQNEEITIRISRDFGYSSGTGKIQGHFSVSASTSVPLVDVVFYLDGDPIGRDTEAPYKIQFNTDDYPQGVHRIYAIGHTPDGKELISKSYTATFVSAKEGNQAALKIVIPVIVLALVVTILSALIPAFSGRKQSKIPPGTERNYGVAGGTICSNCKRPFPRHIFAPNVLLGKLERCPNCGKWSITRSFSISELRQAEKEEVNAATSANTGFAIKSFDEDLKELDDTKYQGL